MERKFNHTKVNDAYLYLSKKDPVLGKLIAHYGPYIPNLPTDPYQSLVRTILFQQLGAPAATAIQKKFFTKLGDENKTPTPKQLLAASDHDFREAGVSKQKMSYLRDLAKWVYHKSLNFSELENWNDTDVITHLTGIKGIGEWSAQMFLMFQLERIDILPSGDLGVRKGMQIAYRLPETPNEKECKKIGEKWAPYRTIGSWYMWKATDESEDNALFV
jgi:DNA-3-methyladenine glycosylase II